MMYIKTPIGTTKQINRMFKYFLWGFSKDRVTRKVPLIAWNRLTHPREDGGLGFMDCLTHLQALLSKWITKALDDPTTEWAVRFLTLSTSITSWDQRRALNRADYTATDRILFGEVTSCGHMKFLAGLWKAWSALCRHLLLNPKGTTLHAHWQVADIVKSLHPFSILDNATTISLLSIMSKLGVRKVQDFWDSLAHEAKDFEDKFRHI